MAITIKKVSTKRELKKFIRFNYRMYKGNPYSVPDLYDDMLNTFNKKKNAAFEFCEADYFLAYRDDKIVGRVAAIINNQANEKWECKNVRFGWIDFIDDMEVSAALLKAVEDYGRDKGMTEMVGPLGFTDLDPEGMLTWGFDQLGTMPTIYNYEYYPKHMETLGGFEVDNKYVEYKLYVPDTVPEKYAKIAQMIQKRYNLHIKKLTRADIFKKGYGQKILFDEARVEIRNRRISGRLRLPGGESFDRMTPFISLERNDGTRIGVLEVMVESGRNEAAFTVDLRTEYKLNMNEQIYIRYVPLTAGDRRVFRKDTSLKLLQDFPLTVIELEKVK